MTEDFILLRAFSTISATIAFFLTLCLFAMSRNKLKFSDRIQQVILRWSIVLLLANLAANFVFHLYLIVNPSQFVLNTGDIAVTRRIPTYTELLSISTLLMCCFPKLFVFRLGTLILLGIWAMWGLFTLFMFIPGWLSGSMLTELLLLALFVLPIPILRWNKRRLQEWFAPVRVANLITMSVISALMLVFWWSAILLQVLSSGGLY